MKQWFIKLILKFLGLDVLEISIAKSFNEINHRLNHHKKSVDMELTRIGSCFNVGVDIHPRSRDSWAVVCTANKDDQAVLKFVDLYGADMRHIMEFLNHSTPRGANRFVDSAYKELIRRGK